MRPLQRESSGSQTDNDVARMGANMVLRRRTPGARINCMYQPGEMLPGYVLNTTAIPGPDL